jgi:hypothetical protein
MEAGAARSTRATKALWTTDFRRHVCDWIQQESGQTGIGPRVQSPLPQRLDAPNRLLPHVEPYALSEG